MRIYNNFYVGNINKYIKFRECELVITDRIHGMIFAAITGTPCIALSNYNYKVKGTYEWIKDLEYIKFTDDIERIPELIDDLKKVKNIKYDNSKIKKEYEKIIEAITV
ncbi:polysaccharide pyruvyl transferase family protein [Paraclostridium bifermentans]|uniref:polysaccharide pyruvyl transferase family protein n=1 Tax=Paraclostridium bifermentans TaxID=1490 RepID=UPI001A9AC24D|nr:polysaccharide pyruvyl transferase family protein [Paraclostridium bifermentans]